MVATLQARSGGSTLAQRGAPWSSLSRTRRERWIGTLRRELLDRTIISNHHQLERLAVNDIDHYNQHRPHRSLDQRPPTGARRTRPTARSGS